MVPFYQLLVDSVLAAAILLFAAWHPFLLKKPIQKWMEIGLVIIGVVLFAGVIYAFSFGHWPFRTTGLLPAGTTRTMTNAAR